MNSEITRNENQTSKEKGVKILAQWHQNHKTPTKKNLDQNH